MANGHDFNPDLLHKEGCTFGQLLASEVAHLKEDTTEIKSDLKEVKAMVTAFTEFKGNYKWVDKAVGYALSALIAGAVALGFRGH